MSLLVTSCTMGKQPDRLLDKGPEYLRTRTNRGLFAHHRKSAVELLAASKAQFYKVPSVSAHDRHDLIHRRNDPDGHGSFEARQQEQLPRSKSEFDISNLRALITDGDNENETIDYVNTPDVDDLSTGGKFKISNFQNQRRSSDFALKFDVSKKQVHRKASVGDQVAIATSPSSLKSNSSFQYSSTPIQSATKSEDNQQSLLPEKSPLDSSIKIPVKPTPLPRKRLEKPLPPPRKSHLKVSQRPIKVDDGLEEKKTSNAGPSSSEIDTVVDKYLIPECETDPKSNLAQPKRKRSLVETLAQHFTSLCTDFQFSSSCSSRPEAKEVDSPSNKESSENSNKECSTDTLYQAKPIYIPRSDSSAGHFQAKPISISPPTNTNHSQVLIKDHHPVKPSQVHTKDHHPVKPSQVHTKDHHPVKPSQNSSDSNNNHKGRKRYPELPMSNKYSNNKRERKTSNPDLIPYSPGSGGDVSSFSPVSGFTSKGPGLEMSIESVERMVYDSEVNAIPSAITTSVDSLGGDGEPREVTRVNSSLSGKMDTQEGSSHLSHSPTHMATSVPRSHSDISCRLEGQHSRDSSLVSSHSRLSRASAGADLEKFFNQMGLERGVLEPISRLKELQNSELLTSVSSIDSQDASSIGSTFSGSENDCSESQSVERTQQPTSVIERNARIIKWLCNVRKAKSQSVNIDGAATSSSSGSPAAKKA